MLYEIYKYRIGVPSSGITFITMVVRNDLMIKKLKEEIAQGMVISYTSSVSFPKTESRLINFSQKELLSLL
jgi:hypothetical protein